MRQHKFHAGDIIDLSEFYEQVIEIANVNKLQACCLYYDLTDSEEDHFTIQVNNFIDAVTSAKKSNIANTKKPEKASSNKKIDYE